MLGFGEKREQDLAGRVLGEEPREPVQVVADQVGRGRLRRDREPLGAVLDQDVEQDLEDRGDLPISEVPTEMFTEVMITNALSPLRVLEALRGLVPAGGTVAVMSSEQGSVSLNTEGGYELYKASKAALNQLMRSYATRYAGDGHTKLLVDPGHNRTALGGPDAPLDPEESIVGVADVLEARAGDAGLRFLDRHGATVPW